MSDVSQVPERERNTPFDAERPRSVAPKGMVGALSPTRYVGGTDGGAPTAGDYLTGDWIVDRLNASIWVCVLGGRPGTWRQAASTAPIKVLAFDFAYNTAGLATGRDIYTPTTSEVVLFAWVDLPTKWAAAGGVFMDVFSDASGSLGMFANILNAPDLKNGVFGRSDFADGGLYYNYALWNDTIGRSGTPRILTADPLKLYVTSDGTRTGANPAATAGAATLYLAIVSPAHTTL